MPKESAGWTQSWAREQLYTDVYLGAITDDMDDATAFASRVEFAQYDGTRLFPARLKRMRKRVNELKSKSEKELAALQRDRQTDVGKLPLFNHWGEPRWEGSEAQRLLKEDIANGKHEGIKPLGLWRSRPEYHSTDPNRFRQHIYQEIRTVKFKKQVRKKAESKLKNKLTS